jgi:hypothetical protein
VAASCRLRWRSSSSFLVSCPEQSRSHRRLRHLLPPAAIGYKRTASRVAALYKFFIDFGGSRSAFFWLW